MIDRWTARNLAAGLVLLCATASAVAATSPATKPAQTQSRSPVKSAAGHRGAPHRAAPRAARAHPAHVIKGPPPPTWTIRPRRHQTPLTRDGFADGDPAPWNARWGCASPAGPTAGLAGAIGVADDELRHLIARSGVEAPAPDYGCVPYSLLTRDDGGVLALAVVAVAGGSAYPSLVLFSREDADGPFVLRTEPWPGDAAGVQSVTLAAGDVLARGDAAADALPADVAFEVGGLVRALLADVDPVDPDGMRIRIATRMDSLSGTSRLLGVELVDPTTGRSLRQALWVARDEVPGGYFTPNGDSLEPVFWANPVAFRYISRGVGSSGSHRRSPAERGRRSPPVRRTSHPMHIGVDFVAPKGTPAVAVADGTVLFMGYFGGYGNLVIVEHAGGFTSHYGHLSSFAPDLATGTEVRRGTTLGSVGMTGLATGPHLHFEIRHEGSYVDPLDHELPVVLWSLRRVDYARLARQVLVLAAPPLPAPVSPGPTPAAEGAADAPADPP